MASVLRVNSLLNLLLAPLGLWITTRGEIHRIKSYINLLDSLPPNSESADALRSHVDQLILDMIDNRKRREPVGVVLGLIFVIPAGWAVYVAFANGGWWWLLGAPALLVGSFGLFGLMYSWVKGRTAR